jgi:hypothetical protein
MSTPYEREQDILYQEYLRGGMSHDEYVEASRELDLQEYGEAQEAAREAAEREMNNRGFF